MKTQATRRTVLGRMTAGGVAVLLGADGGRTMATTSDSSRYGGVQGTPASPVAGEGQEDEPMSSSASEQTKAIWQSWLELWNGDLAIADEIVAPDFVAHFAPVGNSPDEVRGPEGLKGWIGGSLAAFTDYRFATTVGPLSDGDMVAGRWAFRGTYGGGIPGSSPAAVGQPVSYEGADFLRIENGKISEYWLSADILQMLQQIGVIPS